MTKPPSRGSRWALAVLAGAVLVVGCRERGETAKVSRGSVADASSPDRLCPKLAETFYSRNELLVFFKPGSATSAVVDVTHHLEQSPLVVAVSRLDGEATSMAFRELFANQPNVLASVDVDLMPGAVLASIPPLARTHQLDLLDELTGTDGILQMLPASLRGQSVANVLLSPWRLPEPVGWPAIDRAFALQGVTTTRARAAWGAVLGGLARLDAGGLSQPLHALVTAQQRLLVALATDRGASPVGARGLFTPAEWETLRDDTGRVAATAIDCGISLD